MKILLLTMVLWLICAGASMAVVNINTATKEELSTLKGIGESKAQAIIDYRKKHGDFKSIDDLEKVEGIGPGTLKQIRSQISVSGKTTFEKPAKATKASVATKSKSDAMKSDTAKEKVAEKSKSAEKSKFVMKEQKSPGAIGKKAESTKFSDGKGEKKTEKK